MLACGCAGPCLPPLSFSPECLENHPTTLSRVDDRSGRVAGPCGRGHSLPGGQRRASRGRDVATVLPSGSASAQSFTRIVGNCSPTARYTRGVPEYGAHLGQLKLLISEIEFLTPFYGRPCLVVYAGAAPGVHLPILLAMFRSMRFVLVDPQPSVLRGGQYPNVEEVLEECMTDALAERLAGRCPPDRSLLFISDVRVGAETDGETDEAHQARVQRDMDAQRGWVERMRPVRSMLKFRLPWTEGATLYPEGKLYLPVYGKHLTHETRLVVERDAPLVEYDHRLYEMRMAHFNQYLRPSIQPAFVGGRCYDCTAFRWVVCKYLAASRGFDLGSVAWPSAVRDEDGGFTSGEGEGGAGGDGGGLASVDRWCEWIETVLDELKRGCGRACSQKRHPFVPRRAAAARLT